MNRFLFFFAVCCLFVSAACAAPAAPVSAQDEAWLKAAHQVNLEEMQSGALAAQRGHVDTVRTTGQTLASDHGKLDAKLDPVARQLHVKLPDQPTAKAQKQLQSLKGKSGGAFDMAWVHDETDGHIEAIRETKKEIADGTSAQVKKLAHGALPVLNKHLQMLHHASSELHGGG